MSYSRIKLSDLKASLESQDGQAVEVDVKNVAANADSAPKDASVEAGKDSVKSSSADEVTVGFDDPTEETSEAIKQGEEIHKDLVKMVEVSAALEAYAGILNAVTGRNETVSPELAQSIRVGLRSHDRSYFRDVAPALEDFGAPTGSMQVSLELLDNIKGKLKEVGSAAKVALKKLITLIVDMWNNYVNDIPGMLEQVADLKQKMGKTTYTRGKEKQDFSKLLTIDGKFIGGDLEAIKPVVDVAKALLNDWPKELTSYAETVANGNELEAVKKVGPAITRCFSSFTAVPNNEIPDGLEGPGTVTASPVLPGNRRMYVLFNPTEYENESMSKAEQVFKFKFAEVPGADRHDGGQIDDQWASTPAQICDWMTQILNGIASSKTNIPQLNGMLKTLDSEIRDNSDDAPYSAFHPEAMAAIQGALMQHRAFMGYLIQLVKALLAYYTKHSYHIGEGPGENA